ncbi:MAG TPA: diacylglycerol kinase family protein [Candidatus Acidoferrum sp.]|nr:diacylglycerol kinase family protein [Candidatus Acidoferrum sp.]
MNRRKTDTDLANRMTIGLQNALLIHNPNAGRGGAKRRRSLDEARRIFAAVGIEVELAETTGPGEATEIAQRATTERRDLVVACGGDGTLNEVVNGLAGPSNGHRVPLALLPAGTANIFAKELSLPWDIPGAARKLVRGMVVDIALGLATPLREPEKRKYFLSVAGAGPDGKIVYSIDLDLKARLGTLAYWWQGAREIFRYDYPHFRVVIRGQSSDSSLVIVGRTKHYGGPFKITTLADLYEDKFEVMTLSTRSGLRYLSYLPTLWLGKLRGTRGVFFSKTDSLVCEPLHGNSVHAQVDGEPLGQLPVEFKIVPGALKVLVPEIAGINGRSTVASG